MHAHFVYIFTKKQVARKLLMLEAELERSEERGDSAEKWVGTKSVQCLVS